MHLLCYCRGGYQSELVREFKNRLLHALDIGGIKTITLLFDESSAIVSGPLLRIELEKQDSGLLVRSQRIFQKGSRNTSLSIFNKMLSMRITDLVAVDKQCELLISELNHYAYNIQPLEKWQQKIFTVPPALQRYFELFDMRFCGDLPIKQRL